MRSSYFSFDEKSGVYTVKVALPGIAKENVVVHEEDERIVIKHNSPDDVFNISPVWITLVNKIDVESSKAEFDNGVLTLTLPLKQRKRIAIC
jgi:HSP20 family molecular chaperone IbpA